MFRNEEIANKEKKRQETTIQTKRQFDKLILSHLKLGPTVVRREEISNKEKERQKIDIKTTRQFDNLN